MKQRCRCSKCRRTFAVTHAKNAGVWEVYIKIVQAHHEIRPMCASAYGVKFVRALSSATAGKP